MTDRDLGVLVSLRQLRLLTVAQLAALHFPDHAPHRSGSGHPAPTSKAYESLRRLDTAGMVERTRVRGGRAFAYYLTRKGHVFTHGMGDARPYLLAREKADGNAQLHTLAVNDVVVSFVEAARRRGDPVPEVTHEIAHPIGHDKSNRHVRFCTADAVIRYESGDEVVRWFVEAERDKKVLPALMAKLEDYHRLAHYVAPGGEAPAWEEQYPMFPEPVLPEVLVIIHGWHDRSSDGRLASILRETQRRPVLRLEDPPIWFTTIEQLRELGPFGPTWRTVMDHTPRSCL